MTVTKNNSIKLQVGTKGKNKVRKERKNQPFNPKIASESKHIKGHNFEAMVFLEIGKF